MPFYFWIELASFIVSLLVFRKIMNTQLASFVPYLFLIVAYEFGTPRGWFTINKSNHHFANIFMPIEFSFYIFFFFKAFDNPKIKQRFAYSLIALFIFYVANLIFFQGVSLYNSYTYLIGSLIMVGWSCFVFYRLISRPIEINPLQYPVFWISTGILFFFLLRFMIMSHFHYMAYTGDEKYSTLFISISNISIILLYSCIAIGLLCCKPPIRKL
jgi:hypothetical protein